MVTSLGTRLGLNPSQQAKLSEVLTGHFEALQKLRDGDDAPTTRAEWRQRMQTLTQASEQKLGEILTAAQLGEYQKLEPDERIGGGRGQGRGGPGPGGSAETAPQPTQQR